MTATATTPTPTVPKGIATRDRKGRPLRFWWAYTDESGKTLGYTARYNPLDDDDKKQIIPHFNHSNGIWKSGYAGGLRPLWGLHTLDRDGDPIITEGERCAAAAASLGLAVVTSPGGSKAAGNADWSPLAGRDRVVILRDCDTPGEDYASDVARELRQLTDPPKHIVAVVLSNRPESGDDLIEWTQKRLPEWDGFEPVPADAVEALRSELLTEIEFAAVPVENEPKQEPIPLRREADAPEPFPLDELGTVLGDAALALQAAIKAPEAICAQSVLAAAALALQAHANVVIDGRRIPTSLWFLTIAESGERKSSIDSDATWPIRAYEKELRDTYEVEMGQYRAAVEVYENTKRILLKKVKNKYDVEAAIAELGEPPTAPLEPILLMSEPTLEAMHKCLLVGQPSIGLFSSEGGRLLGGNAFGKENKLKTLAGLSELWGGDRIDRVRAGDGSSVLYGRRVSSHLMVQPGVAELLLGDDMARDQGLLSRILISWPESTAGTRTYSEQNLMENRAMRRYGARLLDILRTPAPLVEGKRNELKPRDLPLSEEAKADWVEFHNAVEAQLSPNGVLSVVRGFSNKIPEQAARVAGVLTLVENLNAVNVTQDTMRRAIMLANYYLNESVRLARSATISPDVLLAEKVLEWLNTRSEDTVTLREVYQYGPHATRDSETARIACKLLAKHGYLTLLPGAGRGTGIAKESWRIWR